ncbi:kinesin-like protein KIF26A isoform X2 [Ochotona princeps]|uniref:kinesin-like protein KIF26A isoform X2 n=1 Tax=Ochotona princeps TaxID=9978 RepID=UPI0027148F82|nr:kinesin-like protein KIF26A isoform X2 [Ochotona princeps]
MGGRGAPLWVAPSAAAESGPAREPPPQPPPPLEVPPRKRLPARPEQDPCGSRPAPEGAGAGPEQGHLAGGSDWCRHCQEKLLELKRQAWKLVSGPGTTLREPCLSALLLDKPPVPGALAACTPEAEGHCNTCSTHLHQLMREAQHLLQGPASREDPDSPGGSPSGPDRKKGLAWAPGPSVQVSVSPAGLGGALSTVTIQAQQCLEGMWGVSRVSSFLPPTCLAEAAVAAVAVADTVRDGPPMAGPECVSKAWGNAGTRTSALVTPAPGPSAAASFFIRAAQKFSLASRRKKAPPPPTPAPVSCARGASVYPTDFSRALQLGPPPVPPCLLRAASKAKDNPGGIGKVKVLLRVCPAQGAVHSAESTSLLKVDPRKKQVAFYDPVAGLRRGAAVTVPRMFAFDAVFPQDSEQAEVCSGAVADVLQAVVGGSDGCVFSFGQTSAGQSYTMIGKDSSPQNLGVMPCAICWLFRLLSERRDRTGTRFSVRVSAVELCGRDQSLRDLLAEVASGSLQDTQSPGVYLREDPVCGAQLQKQSELRAPTAERAAFYLDAALAARSTSRVGCGEEARHGSHMLFTLHVYQYRVQKWGQAAMSGGRSRLHLLDLGSCETVPGRAGEASGGSLDLSLPALGSVILALVNGAKHVPYRDHKLSLLLREALAATGCRTTMIAHISDAPAQHAEALSTVQLAARVHRLRRKKAKCASSSSGGESSCEEGRARRPPPLRPCHPRLAAPDPGDPEYSSSSEQSCDTVIYVGPGGAPLSDQELTDHEGPPDFVPIVPVLSRRRPSEGARDADHLRCSTFAELQERLECIDGNDAAQAAIARAGRRLEPPETTAPRKAPGSPVLSGAPHAGPGPSSHWAAPDSPKAGAQDASHPQPEPRTLDKVMVDGGRRPLPGPAPPPPPPPPPLEAEDLCGGGSGSMARTPPVGMSEQAGWPLSAHGHRLERGLLTTTVTLQQPVALNGEDQLVFTLVEELALGAAGGRPPSLASYHSDCSLQALASGSRPVSIISSINDEFDALTAQAPGGPAEAGGRPEPRISSWLSDLSICGAKGCGPVSRLSFSPDSPAGPECPGPPGLGGGSEGSSVGLLQHPNPCPAPSSQLAEAVMAPALAHAGPPRQAVATQSIHSSLPRRPRMDSEAGHTGCCPLGQNPPDPGSLFGDPWLLQAGEWDLLQVGSARPAPGLLPCAQRVVDGCEVAARTAPRPDAAAQIPALRRGATTLGVSMPTAAFGDHATAEGSRRSPAPKGGLSPRPGGVAPPAPPVRKSSLGHKNGATLAPTQAVSLGRAAATIHPCSEEARPGGRAPTSLKARAGRVEGAQRAAGHASPERVEALGHSSGKARETSGRPPRAVPKLGVPPASPTPTPAPSCRGSSAKAVGVPRTPGSGSKGRSLAATGPRAVGALAKPLAPTAGRTPGSPLAGPRVVAKASRGTVMGTKQALRATHSRVHELVAPSRGGPSWGSPDSDSGTDSGVNVAEELPTSWPALPSPYSTVTAPRRPQRYSSGHGSDNSSVLSGELPPAMGRTALFYHSGGSSGYESMIRDSEATGSASSAPDSMSESGASPGARARSLKSPRKRTTGVQRRRLIPAPLPDTAALGRKPSLPGQWVDLPPPLAGSLKEPFEIKVYEIDDVERLQRHRPAPQDHPTQGPMSVSTQLRLAERRQQRLREARAKHSRLCEELAETQGRLMLQPGRWLEQFEVDPKLQPESAEYLEALERATAGLEQCVNLCKARVMMVTCFDISVAAVATAPGPQEVDV